MKTLISVAILVASCAAQSAVAAPPPKLHSTYAVVFDATNQEYLLDKDGKTSAPIASITKVMTAMVALDVKPDLAETLRVSGLDVDRVKNSSSRVAVGTELSREDALHLALMSSENRAASALSRHYPGGNPAFIHAMNEKARKIGMTNTRLEDSTGLSPENRASARDLVRMVLAAERYDPITEFTTSSAHTLPVGERTLSYRNSNPLVGKPNWDIELSKTGYTREAGRCIVMKIAAAGKHLVVVLLGSQSSSARLADIQSIKRWVSGEPQLANAKPSRYVRTKEVRHAAVKQVKRGSVARIKGPMKFAKGGPLKRAKLASVKRGGKVTKLASVKGGKSVTKLASVKRGTKAVKLVAGTRNKPISPKVAKQPETKAKVKIKHA
jgi:D-alanyl-D-alanine endopeptidase (penicillin-binding protein 7)